jgi:hypothetical protein
VCVCVCVCGCVCVFLRHVESPPILCVSHAVCILLLISCDMLSVLPSYAVLGSALKCVYVCGMQGMYPLPHILPCSVCMCVPCSVCTCVLCRVPLSVCVCPVQSYDMYPPPHILPWSVYVCTMQSAFKCVCVPCAILWHVSSSSYSALKCVCVYYAECL